MSLYEDGGEDNLIPTTSPEPEKSWWKRLLDDSGVITSNNIQEHYQVAVRVPGDKQGEALKLGARATKTEIITDHLRPARVAEVLATLREAPLEFNEDGSLVQYAPPVIGKDVKEAMVEVESAEMALSRARELEQQAENQKTA